MRVGERPSPLVARILTGPIQVADLAQTAHLSVSRLSHLLREQVGMAPRTFVEQQRLERARHLLELTSLPVHMAAAQLGFWNQFHSATRFRRWSGTTPSAHRAVVREAR